MDTNTVLALERTTRAVNTCPSLDHITLPIADATRLVDHLNDIHAPRITRNGKDCARRGMGKAR